MSTVSFDSSSTTSNTTSEAVSLVHVPSYLTITVKNHIPISLDLNTPNFARWSLFLRNLCGKFGLLAHLDGPAPATADTTWAQADYFVRSWIIGSVESNILALAGDDDDQTVQ